MGKNDMLMIAGIAVLAYFVMVGGGLKSLWEPRSTVTSGACPRGAAYDRGFFERGLRSECDPNYTFSGLFDQRCECQSKGTLTPAQAKDAMVTANTPTTPDAVDCDIICRAKKALAAVFTPTPAQEKDAAVTQTSGLGVFRYLPPIVNVGDVTFGDYRTGFYERY